MKNVLQVSALCLFLSASVASAQIGPWTSGFIYTVAGDGYGAGLGFGGFSGDGKPAIYAELNFPQSVTVDGAGNIYIDDPLNNRIRKVDAATGIITTFAGDGTKGYSGDGGPAIDAELDLTEGIDWDSTVVADAAGNIYISDQGNNRVRKVDAATGIITTYAGNGSQKISGDGRLATAAGIPAPGGLAIDASGNLYITEFNELYEVNGDFSYLISEFNVVRKVDAATGIVTAVAGNGIHGTGGDGGPATSAELEGPFQVALDGAGNLYIEEVDYPRVRKVDAVTGIITTVAGNGSQGFTASGVIATSTGFLLPAGLAVDAAGDIYISDDAGDRVWRVDAAAGIIEPYAGNDLCLTNDPAACFSGDGGPALSAGMYGPYGLSLDARGNLYIADNGNQRVRVVGSEANAVTTTTTLTASAVELNYGQPLTLTATVTAAIGGTPSGTVSFLSGKIFLGSAVLNDGGVATLTLTPAGGSYSLTAVYSGSPQDMGSASYPPIEVTVNPDSTTTVLTASPNPAYWGTTVTFTATVSSSIVTPTGSVSFYDGTSLLAAESLSSGGVATYSTMALSVGSHNITAVSVATADFSSSTSNIVVEVINPVDFSISAAPGSQTIYTGPAATYTVTITPGTGFAVPVALSCTQLPANTACSFSPATVNGGSGSSTLVVQTSAPRPASSASALFTKARIPLLAGLFLLIIPRRWRRYRKGLPLLLVILAILAAGAAITGCSAPGQLTGATPVGTQTITITGTATNGVQTLTHSVYVTLNVNSLF